MELLENGHLLRIFIGESDRHHGDLLYEWLVKTAREEGLAGATVLRGIMGFGPTSRIRTAKILALSQDLPVVIEIVDTSDRLEAFLARVSPEISQGMAIIERVEVKFYRSETN